MTGQLLLDTHIALWFESGHERLLASTRRIIDDCWRSGGRICVSAVSVWEIAMLLNTRRIEFQIPVEQWMERLLDQAGVAMVPLDHHAAGRSYDLRQFERHDPADRLLIATAIELGCPLVTYDDAITRFARQHGQNYAFAVAT